MRTGEVGTEIAPIIDASDDDSELADRVDAILRRTCSLARALTGAEQSAQLAALVGHPLDALRTARG